MTLLEIPSTASDGCGGNRLEIGNILVKSNDDNEDGDGRKARALLWFKDTEYCNT